MNLFNRILLPAVVVLALASPPVYGEFYQYTDSNGVLRFTDNIAAVPPEQRPDVKIHQSVKNAPDQPVQPAGDIPVARDGTSGTASSPDAASPQSGSWNERITNQASELDRLQVELNKTYRSLQAEREALAGKAPPAGANAEVRAAYQKKVERLNEKIEDYEARYVEFRNKEKAFNDQYRK